MNTTEFDEQFTRLVSHFRLPADVAQEVVAGEWYRAVQHYHVDALDLAVTAMIREAEKTYWPPLGLLLGKIQSRISGHEKTSDACATCHGNTWLESLPYWSNKHVYTCVVRCPDCGVPPPQVKADRYRSPLNSAEYQAFQAGTLEQPTVHLALPRRLMKAAHGMTKFVAPI